MNLQKKAPFVTNIPTTYFIMFCVLYLLFSQISSNNVPLKITEIKELRNSHSTEAREIEKKTFT
jgi:hypothetical protein